MCLATCIILNLIIFLSLSANAGIPRPSHIQNAGELSRNRSVGLRIGRGEKLSEIQASMGGAVAEGVLTSRAAHQLAVRLELECPVIEGIYKVVHGACVGPGGRACSIAFCTSLISLCTARSCLESIEVLQ